MNMKEIRKNLKLHVVDGRVWHLVSYMDIREQVLYIHLKPKGPWNAHTCKYFYGRIQVAEQSYQSLLSGNRQHIKAYAAEVRATIKELLSFISNYYSDLTNLELWNGETHAKAEA